MVAQSTRLSAVPSLGTLPRDRESLLAAARSIRPVIEAEAEAIEANSTLTPPVVHALIDTELFWMFAPAEAGGDSADIVTAIEVIEAISHADASTGWAFMANSLLIGGAAAFLSDEGVEDLYRRDVRPIMAGQLGPIGKAVEVEGGIRGSGKYAFTSGSGHSSHIGCGFHMQNSDGTPRMRPDGLPDAWIGFVPRDQIVFKGNWDVMGMAGTGSFDLELPETFIPSHRMMEMFGAGQRRGRAGFAIGLIANGYAGHSAVVLGLMARALEEVVRITGSKSRLGYSGPAIDYPLFQHQFATQEAAYNGSRAYLLQCFRDAEMTADTDNPISPEQNARLIQSAIALHAVATGVVQFCHVWGGTASFRNPSRLGRCVRDMLVATQHLLVDQKALVDCAPDIIASWKR